MTNVDNSREAHWHQIKALQESRRGGSGPLPPGDGGSTLDGMNAWQQTVETRLGEMRQDIRDVGKKVDSHFVLTWGGLIIGFLGMAGLMAKGFGWL